MYNIIEGNDVARLEIKEWVKYKLSLALDKFTIIDKPYLEADSQLGVFFSQLSAIKEIFSEDPSILKLIARLRIWSASQLIFDSDVLSQKNPLNTENCVFAGMSVSVHARNLAAVQKWLQNGQFGEDLFLSEISPKNRRLMFLSGALTEKLDSPEKAMLQRAPVFLQKSLEYLNSVDRLCSDFVFDKKLRDSMGFGRNSCWSALAFFEARRTGANVVGELQPEQIMKMILSDSTLDMFNGGYISTDSIAPCVELADFACAKENLFCDQLKHLVVNFAFPRVASDAKS